MTIGPYELNQIYTGECSALMAELPTDSIPFWLTSPPYDSLREYRGYTFPFEAIAQQLYRVTQPGGVGVWVVADETKNGSESGTSFRQALYFMGLGFNLHDTMIYERDTLPFPETSRYEQCFQFMFIFSKGPPRAFNPLREKTQGYKPSKSSTTRQANGTTKTLKYQQGLDTRKRFNIWRFSTGFMKSTLDKEAFDHPAIFPEALARDHILSWSNPGDLVLEPMCGSGTVPKMAYLTGRNFLGFEISEEYTDLARRRVQMAMSQPALFNPYQPAEKVEPIQVELF